MNKVVSVGIGATALMGSMLVGIAPSSANIQTLYQGSDYAYAYHGYTACGTCEQEHRKIGVIDNECDGHTTSADYYVEGLSTQYHVKDEDGCAGGGWSDSWVDSGRAVVRMRVCEQNDDGSWGCTAYKSVFSHAWA